MTPDRTTMKREVVTLGPFVACLGMLLLLAVRGDAGPREMLLGVAAVGLFHVLPGALAWRCIRPVHGWLVEDLAMGFVLGACLSVPTQIVTAATGWTPLVFAVPLALAVALVVWPTSRTRIRSRTCAPLPWWWGPAVATALVYPVLEFIDALSLPVRWKGFAGRSVDMPFHESLVGEIGQHFPAHYPFVAHEEVAYHWFGHAWTANIVALAHTPIDVTLWRITPALVAVAAPVLVAVAAVRISQRPVAGPIAGCVAFLGPVVRPWVAATPLTGLEILSPSQQFAMVVLPALLVVLAMRWRDQLARGVGLPLLVVLLVIAGGAKGTTIAILIPGLLLATAAVLLFDRDRARSRTVALDTGVAIVVFLLLRKIMFDGSGESLEVAPFDWLVERTGAGLGHPDATFPSVVGLCLLVLATLQCALSAIALMIVLWQRSGRGDPILWTLFGASVAGYGALVVFTHPGDAQGYFYKTSLAALGIGAGCALSMLLEATSRRVRVAGAGLVTGVVVVAVVEALDITPDLALAVISLAALGVCVLAVWVATRRQVGTPVAAVVVSTAMLGAGALGGGIAAARHSWPERPVADDNPTTTWLHDSQVAAYRWVRDHTGPDDLLATNKHCTGFTVPGCSRRVFTISAYTERRVLVEGWAYVPRASARYDADDPTTTNDIPYWDEDLLAANDAFFEKPSVETRQALLDLGVTWLVLVRDAPHAPSLKPFAKLRHRTTYVDVYQFPRANG